MTTDFDRKPKPTELDMRSEWQGEEGLVIADFSPFLNGAQIRVETIHGATTLSLDDLEKLYAAGQRYMSALNAVRAADEPPVINLRGRVA